MLDQLSAMIQNPYVIAILVYLFALVGVGAYKALAVKGSDDFMVAGRALPWYILVGTLLATWMGSGSLFSGAGLGYRNGPAGLWMSAGGWVGIVVVYFIARRIRNFGKITIPDIFEARYGQTAGLLATITTVIAYLTIVSYQFKGGGKVLHAITDGDVSEQAGIVITALFAILYTILAGMLSVVYTDVVNGAIMSIGMLLGLGWLVVEVGGLDTIISTAEAAGKWSWFGHWAAESTGGATSGPIVALAMFTPTMLLLLGDANMYQRIFSAKDATSARKAVAFWIIGVIVLESAIGFFGLCGSVAAEQGLVELNRDTSENVVPVVVRNLMSPWLGMLLVATMMAVIVSTADSFLLVPATNLTRDVYQRFIDKKASDLMVVFVSRCLILALGIVAFFLVAQFPKVLDAAYTAYLIYGASITPALLAAFLWKRATALGAVTSVIMGAAVTIVWRFALPKLDSFETWNPFLQEATYPAVVLSVGSLIVVSLLTPAPPREVWGKFFDDS